MTNEIIIPCRFEFFHKRNLCFPFLVIPIMFILFLPLDRSQIIQLKITPFINIYHFHIYKPQSGFVWEVLTYV